MDTITKSVARVVLWHYGVTGGTQPGAYTQLLMRTIDHADRPNTELLRGAYPGLVEAMFLAGNSETGIATLQKIAQQIECVRCHDSDGPFAEAPEKPLCEACHKLTAVAK